jgi:hypothetical protein
MRRSNPARRRKAYERNYGERAEHVRDMRCLVDNHECRGRVVAAHVKARGMGGCNGDRRSLVPLCWAHHDEQGGVGIATFQARHGLDLHAKAEEIAHELDDAGVE